MKMISSPKKQQIFKKYLHVFFIRVNIYSLLSASVAELVDAPDLGSGAARCGSSTLPARTTQPSVYKGFSRSVGSFWGEIL